MTPKPPARSKAILTPLGAWHAARLKLLARLGAKCQTEPTVDARRHFLDGGPFAVCGCGFKEPISLIGMTCMRCGQRADGPFVIRRGVQIKCEVTK